VKLKAAFWHLVENTPGTSLQGVRVIGGVGDRAAPIACAHVGMSDHRCRQSM